MQYKYKLVSDSNKFKWTANFKHDTIDLLDIQKTGSDFNAYNAELSALVVYSDDKLVYCVQGLKTSKEVLDVYKQLSRLLRRI